MELASFLTRGSAFIIYFSSWYGNRCASCLSDAASVEFRVKSAVWNLRKFFILCLLKSQQCLVVQMSSKTPSFWPVISTRTPLITLKFANATHTKLFYFAFVYTHPHYMNRKLASRPTISLNVLSRNNLNLPYKFRCFAIHRESHKCLCLMFLLFHVENIIMHFYILYKINPEVPQEPSTVTFMKRTKHCGQFG